MREKDRWGGEHIPCFGDVLSVADGQAHHIADINPANGCSVLLIFIVTKKSTFQRTPTADRVWNTCKYINMRFNYWVLDSKVNSLSHLVVLAVIAHTDRFKQLLNRLNRHEWQTIPQVKSSHFNRNPHD